MRGRDSRKREKSVQRHRGLSILGKLKKEYDSLWGWIRVNRDWTKKDKVREIIVSQTVGGLVDLNDGFGFLL